MAEAREEAAMIAAVAAAKDAVAKEAAASAAVMDAEVKAALARKAVQHAEAMAAEADVVTREVAALKKAVVTRGTGASKGPASPSLQDDKLPDFNLDKIFADEETPPSERLRQSTLPNANNKPTKSF